MKDDLYPFQLPLSVIISATVTFCRLGGLHHAGSAVEIGTSFCLLSPSKTLMETLSLAPETSLLSNSVPPLNNTTTHHPHHTYQ